MPPQRTRQPSLRLTPPPTGLSWRRTNRQRAPARRSPRSLRRGTWIDRCAIRASTAFERDSAAHGRVRSMAAALLPSAAEAVHGATGATGAIARDPRNPVYRRGVSNMFSSDNERSTGRSGQVSPRVALVRPVRGVPGVAAHTSAGRDDRRTSNGPDEVPSAEPVPDVRLANGVGRGGHSRWCRRAGRRTALVPGRKRRSEAIIVQRSVTPARRGTGRCGRGCQASPALDRGREPIVDHPRSISLACERRMSSTLAIR